MLQELRNLFETGGYAVYGLLVQEEGETVLALGDCTARHPVYSATKSFTATAAGMLQDAGKWSVDDPLAAYLPREAVEGMPPGKREAFRLLPISRFLTMSVPGYPFRPEGEDWLAFALSCPADYTCPPAFSYSNIPAYLVGLAAGNAAGEPLSDYLRRELLVPLGIESPVFRTDPQGRFYGATGMELSVEELSRLGRLYMQDGLWNGKRLFSGSWAEAAVRPQIDAGKGQGYGYFFWTGLRDFSVSGKWGQKCLVYPGRKLIISWEGEMPETSGRFERAVRQLVSDGGDR